MTTSNSNNGNKREGRQTNFAEVIKSFDAHAGGGSCRAITVTAFFDANGNLIGKTSVRVVNLYPDSIFEALARAVES